MDEDEKEMLSEARARLSNTQGKKAKRKAREKQLEEARRLAQLQKRREMREAGITWRRGGHKRKRKWGVDYNAEIPFYKKAPKGYFDTSTEKSQGFQVRSATNFLGKTAEEINGERRDVIEERERKKDARRQKLHRKTNLPEHLIRINKMNDVPTVQNRAEMILPAPQLNDTDLEQISRMGGVEVAGQKGGATSTLLANYDQTPQVNRTPMRTPLSKDTLLEEAQNIIKLRDTATPLLGGHSEKVDLKFGGVAPQHQRLVTPNPLATPSRVGGTPARGGAPATPASVASGVSGVTGVTGMTATPLRDGLGINEMGGMTPRTAILEKQRLANLKKKMKAGFGKLPKAKYKYAIVVPKVADDKTEEEEMEVDAEDAAALKAARAKAKEELEKKTRSLALQRNLPRPIAIGNLKFATEDQSEVSRMIHTEMDTLIRNDEVKYPPRGAANQKRKMVEAQDFSYEEMQAARQLLEEEVQKVIPSDAIEIFENIWNKCTEDVIFLPSQREFGKLSSVSKKDQLTAIKQEFELTRQYLARDSKKAQKLANKLNIMLGGYFMRTQKLGKKIFQDLDEQERSERDGRCFAELMQQEEAALPIRVKSIQSIVETEAAKEAAAQQKFADLSREKEELMAELKIVNEVI